MADIIPPAPVNDPPNSYGWIDWYVKLVKFVNSQSNILWANINKAGANITDIPTRLHNDLQTVQGGAVNEKYHLSLSDYNVLIQTPLPTSKLGTGTADASVFLRGDGTWAATGGGGGGSGAQGVPGVATYLEADPGEQGEMGPPGPPGATGATGAQGIQGLTGAQGPAGPPIFLEADVIEGEMGPPGPQGVAGASGAVDSYAIQTATYTLTSTTVAQKIFNGSTNGAVTLDVGTYTFESTLYITSMSATSGNAAFSFTGTATLASCIISSSGIDSTALSVAALSGVTAQGTSTTTLVTAGVGTGMSVTLRGAFRVTATGTVIPSIALSTAAAAIVGIGSYIKFSKISSSTAVTGGNWS